MTAEQENVQVVQGLYAAFQRGDFAAFRNTLADEVEWFVHGPQPILPWAGLRKGREQVAQFFAEFAQTAETQQFKPREVIAQGERVVVHGYCRDRVKPTGRIFESEWAQVFSLHAGKIVSFHGYIDLGFYQFRPPLCPVSP